MEKVNPPNFAETTECRRKILFGESRRLRRFSAEKFLLFCREFIAWENEKVTWLLGRRSNEWKIVGFFIRDIRNPE